MNSPGGVGTPLEAKRRRVNRLRRTTRRLPLAAHDGGA